MDLSSLGRTIILLGVALAIVGVAIWLLGRAGLSLSSLPGDIRMERENMSCYVPIVTTILSSVVLSIVLNVIVRLLNH